MTSHIPFGLASEKAQKARWLRDAVAGVLIALMLGWVSLLYPFGRDQGEYAAIAAELGRGKVAYRDVFDVKPPLTHAVHGLALRLFGHSMQAIRWLDLLWQAATVALLAVLAALTFGRRAYGALAAFLYSAWYYALGYWNTAQTDGFLTLFLALGLITYTRIQTSPSAWPTVVTGVALGTSMLLKYPAGGLFWLGLLGLTVVGPEKNRWPRAAGLTLGFALPLAACGLALALRGGLNDFLLIQMTCIPSYRAFGGGAGGTLRRFAGLLLLEPWLLLPLGSVAGLWILWRRGQRPQAAWLGVWWLCALLHLFGQNKFYAYHTAPLLAPGALLSAFLIGRATRAAGLAQPGKQRALQVVVSVVLALHLDLWYLANQRLIGALVAGGCRLEDLYALLGDDGRGDYSMRADMEVAAYLRTHTSPSEELFVWGFEPAVYFLAKRGAASRFLYNFPLYGSFPWRERLQAELMNELRDRPPRYIAIVRRDAIPWVTGTEDDSLAAFEKFHELRDRVSNNYALETQLEDFYLYRLKGP